MSSAANSKFVQQQLRDENEDLYDVAIMLTIRAVTLKKLMSQKKNIKRLLRSKDYFVEETRNYTEEATYMSFPLLMVDKHIFQKAKRNMLTSSLASTYFFTAFELYDNDGLESDDFEKIVATDVTKEALKMIVYDRFDNSAGSTEYKEFYN